MPHGAAHNAPQHIAASLIRRQHAIGDQETRRPEVIRDNPVTRAVLPFRLDAGRFHRSVDERTEKIDIVIVVHALQHRGNALQSHAGIDRRTRQRHALLLRHLLVLHEDEVPDLDEPVAVFIRAAGRTARNAFAVIVEYLGARTARARVPHGPEIVAGRNADDPAIRQAGDLLPVMRRLVIGVIDRDQQPARIQPELPGDQVPGEFDRTLLEIVAEREVAEHLEEGVMARRIADIVEVVVLAAGAHALLRGHGARVAACLQPREDVLELYHSGIGEHQCRVVARHERAGGNDLVTVLPKIVEEGRPDFVDATHIVAFA